MSDGIRNGDSFDQVEKKVLNMHRNVILCYGEGTLDQAHSYSRALQVHKVQKRSGNYTLKMKPVCHLQKSC